MLIGTYRMRMKVRHLKPKYPILGMVEWVVDFFIYVVAFLGVFGLVYYLLTTFAGGV
jgi:hypothetical protein